MSENSTISQAMYTAELHRLGALMDQVESTHKARERRSGRMMCWMIGISFSAGLIIGWILK